MINKIMESLNRPFKSIITLIISYFALVSVSIALYALIQIFFKSDTATASSLLGWTATMFATIALLYVFNRWRDQKGSEVIANEANEIVKNLSSLNDDIRYITSYFNIRNNALSMFDDIKKLSNKNRRELFFLRSSIVDEELESLLEIFLNKESELFERIEYYLITNNNINDFLNEMGKGEMISTLRLYTNYLDDLITVIRPYSLYQKSIVLKEHKPKSV